MSMKEDFFQKAYKDAVQRQKNMRFLKWVEATYPNLRAEYRRYRGDEE